MNKLLGSIFLVMVLFAIAASVFASEFSVSVTERTRDADEDVYSVGAWYGVQFSYAPKDKGYFFISQETAEIAPIGHVFDYHMTGFGVGSKYQVTDGIKLFGQVGYYIVKNTWGYRPHTANESLGYYSAKRYTASATSQTFHGYGVENENTIAGTVGVEFNHKFTKSLIGNMTFSKRVMRIHEVIRAFRDEWNYEQTGVCIMTGLTRNFTSTELGLGLTYTF